MRQPTQPEWATICELFDKLVDLPAEMRAQRLARPDVDPYVADQVGSMLHAGQTSGLLDRHNRPAPPRHDYASLAPGTIVGAFRIERLIGRGGMGEVYLAERAEGGFAQRVALKLLRPEAASRAALFDAERALLASLEHSGIARLIDGGIVEDGRPYMALEYVEGEEIDTWCAAHAADLDMRLSLFLEICDAVTYAHARLVVHRDIKPANILIDGNGRARLLDFGIARIVDEGAADRTTTQALLTPDYAAPEQLENAPTTVATDVHALGAVLFELLTGRGPWRQGEASMPSIIRRILHEDPPVPSRLAAELGDAPLPPQHIAGDLDAIVLKAMRRDPAARYGSVADLAADVRRHRDFLPVQARNGSAGYYLRRFVRRNRWGVAAAAAALLALVAGAGGVVWQARQTAVERDIARAEVRRGDATLRMLTNMLSETGREQGGDHTTVREMLDRASRRLVASLDTSPRSAQLLSAMSDMYLSIYDFAAAERLIESGLARRVGADDPAAIAELHVDLALLQAMGGRTDAARGHLATAERIFAVSPARYQRQMMDLVTVRSFTLRSAGNPGGGADLLIANLPQAEATFAENRIELLSWYNAILIDLLEARRLDEVPVFLQRSEILTSREGLANTVDGIDNLQQRGRFLMMTGRPAHALIVLERVVQLRRTLYGPSLGLALGLNQRGKAELALDRHDAAIASFREAWTMGIRYSGSNDQRVLSSGLNLAEALSRTGRAREAAQILATLEPAIHAQPPESEERRRLAEIRTELTTNDDPNPRSGLNRLRQRIPAPTS